MGTLGLKWLIQGLELIHGPAGLRPQGTDPKAANTLTPSHRVISSPFLKNRKSLCLLEKWMEGKEIKRY
jgi:hypothetical protein